jgi:hypothetical protein
VTGGQPTGASRAASGRRRSLRVRIMTKMAVANRTARGPTRPRRAALELQNHLRSASHPVQARAALMERC